MLILSNLLFAYPSLEYPLRWTIIPLGGELRFWYGRIPGSGNMGYHGTEQCDLIIIIIIIIIIVVVVVVVVVIIIVIIIIIIIIS